MMKHNLQRSKSEQSLIGREIEETQRDTRTKSRELPCHNMGGHRPIVKEVNDLYSKKQPIVNRSPVRRTRNLKSPVGNRDT